MPFSGLFRLLHTYGAHTYTQACTHMNRNNVLKVHADQKYFKGNEIA